MFVVENCGLCGYPEAAQAVELVRALRAKLNEMTVHLDWVERHAATTSSHSMVSAMRSEALGCAATSTKHSFSSTACSVDTRSPTNAPDSIRVGHGPSRVGDTEKDAETAGQRRCMDHRSCAAQ